MKKYVLVFFASLLLGGVVFAFLPTGVELDSFGRLVKYPGKTEVVCPLQDDRTAVFLVMGQSNSANHGQKKFTTRYPDRVFNYFNGKCYVAESPLLGASGVGGEFITPMADNLIDNGDYDRIVLISSGIGGTPIQRWIRGGDLNQMAQTVVSDARSRFHVTEILWHQGEANFGVMSSDQYRALFHSFLQTFRKEVANYPPIYYAVATKCGEGRGWTPDNDVALGQKMLSNLKKNIFLGANTDELLLPEDRGSDQCHFSESGQIKAAYAFAEAIHKANAVRPNEIMPASYHVSPK